MRYEKPDMEILLVNDDIIITSVQSGDIGMGFEVDEDDIFN